MCVCVCVCRCEISTSDCSALSYIDRSDAAVVDTLCLEYMALINEET